MSPIRVMVVDDQDLVRDGIAMIIDSQDDLRVVAQATDGHDAVETVRRVRCDVVLMDVRMPGLDGIGATEQIRALPDGPRVIVLTTFDLDEHVFSALRAGASGFLVKSSRAEQVAEAVRVVHRGDSVMAPSSTRRLIDHVLPSLPGSSASLPELARLTEREREVLLEVATGASNAEIGARLYLSEATVKTHVGRLLTKLGVRDRVQLVVLAYEHGLVRPDR
ncbi:response regulator transcription factor [Aeromicrobium sp. YIM 150415]|uniref:response regulator transcription factor n=1 Tax=Aeromicrobium sp. YIM 150415 TaxID=2803912 RepID=UPI001965F387|nr:response regulator transcription factor [Aeromicrobium sp. YIM 150415]MBM9464599.1 response regulator transcription factor [Aeromicrobium sp. YIM 150415]